MEDTLNKLSETSPEFPERMFINLKKCVACYPHCGAKPYMNLNAKRKFLFTALWHLKCEFLILKM
jgi:hypothetical protein